MPRAFLLLWALLGLAMAGCASTPPPEPAAAAPTAATAATVSADEVAGSWGFASYHQDAARARTETMARTQCRQPYVIRKGPTGGVIMHLADSPTPEELQLKGGPGGKNYIGPAGDIGAGDREIVSIDGRVMILRWLDADVAGRYGTSIYVRCARA